MNTVELFSGTKSFSKVASTKGFRTFTVDNNPQLQADLVADVETLKLSQIPFNQVDILWASPPCTGFSVAAICHHWKNEDGTITPKSQTALQGLLLLEKSIIIINELKPTKWYIENPRGMMRKVIDAYFKKHGITTYVRHTVSYCQYGDTRMKPTDIWTNDFQWTPKPLCKNGSPCHEPAPRGSKTGTQGLKNATDRGIIPAALFHEVLA